MKNKELLINMISSIVSFVITMGISFFLTPFIVGKLGREAYGFIGLINNIISYASVVTIALNSMAGRFITLASDRAKSPLARTLRVQKIIKIVLNIIYGHNYI